MLYINYKKGMSQKGRKKDGTCLFLSAWNETKTHISIIDWERWSSLKNNRSIYYNRSLYQNSIYQSVILTQLTTLNQSIFFKSFNHFINHLII